MHIEQWEDDHLAHFSYAVVSDLENKIMLIDPSRDPARYLQYAKDRACTIVGIIETHPHADFISGHAELAQLTNATIYTSSLVEASYQHTVFNDGDSISLGEVTLNAMHTPGHSPDSISVLVVFEGKEHAIFSGDTLFIGDCGRPDLRDDAEGRQFTQHTLARQMYHSLRESFLPLGDEVILYPAHGAGTLCGKNLRKADSSTMGEEKKSNWSLQEMTEEAFVAQLLQDQPFIPAYFPNAVRLNRKGAAPFSPSIAVVHRGREIRNMADAQHLEPGITIVDARAEDEFKKGHLPHAINIMAGKQFDTWLGTLVKPGEGFYLAAADPGMLEQLLARTAAIGYETQVRSAFVLYGGTEQTPAFDLSHFRQHPQAYTIVDIRNEAEVQEKKLFADSLSIPLPELKERAPEIPRDKPILVHCAGGYRSAAGSSLLQSLFGTDTVVFDLGEAVEEFIK